MIVAASGWRVRRTKTGARLTCLGTGEALELGGEAAADVVRLLEQARRPIDDDDARAALAALDDDEAAAAVATLLERGLLRAFAPSPRVRVGGRGPLRRALQDVVDEGGWTLAPLTTQASAPSTSTRVVVAAGGLVALGSDACAGCVELRLLGATGRSGEDQERRRRSWRRGPRELSSLAAALLLALSRSEPLGACDVVLVGRDRAAVRAVVVAHPDCPAHVSRASSIAQALERGPRAPDRAARRALLDPTLGPLVLHEEPGPPGTYPYDAPFVWGSVRLTRLLGGRARCASTYAGIYGKGKDAETCRRMALSEGVERLAAMGATATTQKKTKTKTKKTTTKQQQAALAALHPTSTPQERARARSWVAGLDLLSGQPVPLPFEDVAVRLPRGAYPAALVDEPFYSGCASHLTFKDAVLHATHELLERDAFVFAWYRQRALPALAWPTTPTELTQTLSSWLQARGMKLEVFSLALDVPVPMLLLRATASKTIGCWPKGGAMLFAASAFSAARSLERVLSLACGQFISFALHPAPEKNPLDAQRVRALDRRAPGWAAMCRLLDGRRAPEHAFLDGATRLPFEALPGTEPASSSAGFDRLAGLLRDAGLSWWCARLTDAHMERAGFEVAKVVIPGLLRLTTRRERVALRAPRLLRPWPDAQRDTPSTTPHPLY